MFRPEEYSSFRFVSRDFDPETSCLRLKFALDEQFEFLEEYRFPHSDKRGWATLSAAEQEVLDRLFLFLHLAAGVSYFKAAVPKNLLVESGTLSPFEAEFFTSLYRFGLGEFAFKNGLSLKGRCQFPALATLVRGPITLPDLGPGVLVPLGGGKDSLVSVELLRPLKRPMATYILGNFSAIERVAEVVGLPLQRAARTLDPLLFELNRQGALNGHVPISAIFSLTAIISGILSGFPTVIASQERSANVGNTVHEGVQVNHQYSKSLEFERGLKALITQSLSPQLCHFSLLRPFSEIQIAKIFSEMKQYHQVFSSCNRLFHLQSTVQPEGRWCCNCPKCRFVFLALAPFLEKSELLQIFPKNLLDDVTQIAGFQELLGQGAMKPFECVGEHEEARWCVKALLDRGEWQSSPVLRKLSQGDLSMENAEELFRITSEHEIPLEYLKGIHAFA